MIAILLATYNGEKYLSEQIASIINQTYKDWILYIHDDGSTDSTIDIIKFYCEKYKDRIFFLNDSKSQKGPAYSFMWLLKHTTADYYMFCDQDDYWDTKKIEISFVKIHELELQHPHLPIIVHTDLEIVDKNLKTISKSLWKYTKLEKIINKQSLYSVYNVVTGCTMIINKKTKELVFPINPLLLMHDSWITQTVVFNNGIVYPIHKQLIKYRQHENNVLGAGNKKKNIFESFNIKESLKVNFKIYKLLNNQFNFSVFNFILIKLKYFLYMHIKQ